MTKQGPPHLRWPRVEQSQPWQAGLGRACCYAPLRRAQPSICGESTRLNVSFKRGSRLPCASRQSTYVAQLESERCPSDFLSPTTQIARCGVLQKWHKKRRKLPPRALIRFGQGCCPSGSVRSLPPLLIPRVPTVKSTNEKTIKGRHGILRVCSETAPFE